MSIKEKIIEVSKILDELDDFENSISETDKYYDLKLSDLYHKLEEMKLNSKFCYRFCKELKSVLKERREHKNEVMIFSKYRSNDKKLNAGKNNRQLMLSEINKREKNINLPYNYRIYTEEELEKILVK